MTNESLKVCSICQISQNINQFNKRKRSSDGYQGICRECNKKRSKDYYNDNKSEHINNVYKRKVNSILASKVFVFEYFKSHGCVDCPEKDPVVLDFDHVRGKKYRSISRMVHTNNSLEKIKKEIEKCEVRCANCHRRKTAKDLKYFTYIMGL